MNFLDKKHQDKKLKKRVLFFKTLIFIMFGLMFFSVARANFTSPSFTVENPVNVIGGVESSSSSFQSFGVTGQLENGQSSSNSFLQNAGFMYFPLATSPTVSATAGNGKVVLNWTVANGIFANITTYKVGVSTTSGGTYVYTSVGNVQNATQASLTNGIPYFFKIQSYASGVLLSESAEVSATPTGTIVTPPSGGGGGGGGGNQSTPTVFSGSAYPGSTVFLLKDAQVLTSTVADSNANFSISVNSLTTGNYIFSVYSEDSQGNRSSLLTFPVSVTTGTSANIGGIFIAPTISADKSEVKKGDNITFFGQSVPNGQISLAIHSNNPIFKKTQADKNGAYLQVVDSSLLDLGAHTAMSKAVLAEQISSDSSAVSFTVGDTNISTPKIVKKTPKKGDLNGNGKVDFTDLSIMTYWYGKANPPAKFDLNGDGKVDFVDFSIMIFYWTG